MSRKIVEVTIATPGRDFGKVFRLTEMPARQAENWAVRALLALARSGIELDEQTINSGMIGFANLSLRLFGNLPFDDARSLLDEMMTCVTIRPSPIEKPMIERAVNDDDIEEVLTRFKLRMEIIALHVGFSIPGYTSTAVQAAPLY
jgi:hypothetical protein